MKGSNLGEFEELVLLAVWGLKEDAYAVSIQQCIEKRAQRSAAMGPVYTGLDRLEQKGFLESELGEVTRARGGRRKRFYKITAAGITVLNEAREARERMWAGIKLNPMGGVS